MNISRFRMLTALLPVTNLAICQTSGSSAEGIHKIRHVIIIMQENRSFDSYFGTFPGADGIPRKEGAFAVYNPDPATGQCTSPYHHTSDANGGGHASYSANQLVT